jgi:hypothetical protein
VAGQLDYTVMAKLVQLLIWRTLNQHFYICDFLETDAAVKKLYEV